jgi:hypothetical protein
MASSDVSLRELAQIIKRIDERTAHIDQVTNGIAARTAHIDQVTNGIAAGMRLPSGMTLSNAIGQILNAVT